MTSKLPEFLANHWILVAILVFLVLLWLIFEGIQWRRRSKSLSAAEATRLVNHDNAVFVDIRSQAVYEQGHIPGAISAASDNIQQAVKQLGKHKADLYVLYCQQGFHAQKMAQTLKEQDISNLAVLQGGFDQWRNDGLPVEKKR